MRYEQLLKKYKEKHEARTRTPTINDKVSVSGRRWLCMCYARRPHFKRLIVLATCLLCCLGHPPDECPTLTLSLSTARPQNLAFLLR